MPLFATLVKGLFGILIGWFGQFVTKRIALALAVASLFVALTGALVVGLSAASSSVLAAMPSFMNKAVCWFWPSNGNAVISAVLSANAVRWAYDIQVKVIQLKWNF